MVELISLCWIVPPLVNDPNWFSQDKVYQTVWILNFLVLQHQPPESMASRSTSVFSTRYLTMLAHPPGQGSLAEYYPNSAAVSSVATFHSLLSQFSSCKKVPSHWPAPSLASISGVKPFSSNLQFTLAPFFTQSSQVLCLLQQSFTLRFVRTVTSRDGKSLTHARSPITSSHFDTPKHGRNMALFPRPWLRNQATMAFSSCWSISGRAST